MDTDTLNADVDYTLLVDTAVLAGQIMLTAGAETYRVEDTIRRILATSGFDKCDVFAIPTGIMVTLADWRVNTISVTRRIGEKNTDLYNIYKANDISRKYCEGSLSLKEAFYELKHMNKSIYPAWLTKVCMLFATAGFTLLLGGYLLECAISMINGLFILGAMHIGKKMKINSFVVTMSAAFMAAFFSRFVMDALFPSINIEVLIAGSNMALLPGVAITNAIRDTLQGDYTSGGTRAIEAFVIAMAVGVGTGAGFAAGDYIFSLIRPI